MPKQKTKKTIFKRFKITAKGKLLRKHAQTSHLKRKEDTSSKNRKKALVEANGSIINKIKKLI